MSTLNLIEEIAEITNLLENIKQEYIKGIKVTLKKNDSSQFRNIHIIPNLEKIQINRGLGLYAQNLNILKKSIQEFRLITGQKPIITKAKKAIASFKVRKDMELGLSVTLRGDKMYTFLTKLIFFTFSQIRDFRGLSVRSFDKAGNYTLGLNEQLIFPEIDYEDVDQTQGFTITLVFSSSSPKNKSRTVDKFLNNMLLLNFLRFPLNDCGYYEKYVLLGEINKFWNKKKHLNRKRWSQE